MTTISTVYDAFTTMIEAEISGYAKIPDPYAVAANPDLLLNRAYGLAIAEGEPFNNASMSCRIGLNRIFELHLLRAVASTDFDVSGRNTIEKDMFEDQLKIIKAVDQDPTISASVANTQYLGDSGLLYLQGENLPSRFFLLTTTFQLTYLENLNS